MRLLLHRACFLHSGKNEIDDDFLRAVGVASAKACLSAARDAIWLINEQYEHKLLNSLWYNLHCKWSHEPQARNGQHGFVVGLSHALRCLQRHRGFAIPSDHGRRQITSS